MALSFAEVTLTPDELAMLDGGFDRGYPYTLLEEVCASYGLPRRDVL